MKSNQRARGPVTRRRGWHILEAPQDPNVARENRRKRATEPRRRAWHILEAPTGEQPAPPEAEYGPPLPDDTTVNFVLDLVLRIGEVQMASGAGASDVTATILALTSALGLPHCEVDVIFTSITVTCHRGTAMAPVSALRVVRSRSLDYTRLSATELLVREITRGKVSAEEAYAALQRITNAPHPYPRWVATLAWGGMAFFVTLLIGGSAEIAFGALVISALVDRLGRQLNKYALPFFFQQVVGGLVATGLATLTVETGIVPTKFSTLVAAAAITVLLSGLSTVSAVQDAITGYNVTAAGRTMETGLMSAGLITGVALALNISKWLGFMQVEPELPAQTALGLPVVVVAGAGTAACFALGSYSTLRALLTASAAGAIGAGVYGGLVLAAFDPITSSAIAAVIVGFCGGVLSRRLKVTPLVVAVSGITPLLPGLSTYRGLYELATQSSGNVSTLMKAVAIGLALAAGVVLGEYLAQPVRTGLGRLERRLAGPRMAGPLRPSDSRLE
ncbi:threonine/serine ThrE exporter family protein [Amycolatopsis pithecellobii]|uniref:Threonine/serine exporter family protein n=1 Tax=Amycolatopsis pithecellobii TaxID=664692 RepID=A0A6N7ZAH9_9PSEU|nr:threonine/serine exporter family protein [Amycolatopsis pithecellobii]MTD58752.1 threonine/serine exporter family protein [Amycolatopsis pithecellobii]